MAGAVLSYVVKRVGDFLIDEAVFLYEVKDQVEWVKDELLAMQCFLKDADAKSRGDERVKNWVRNVREIAYRAEDFVESFVLDVQRRRRRSKGFIWTIVRCARLPRDLILLRQFGKEIDAIKAKIGEINERRNTYGIQNLGIEARRQVDKTVRERRRIVLHAADDDLVGMDEEKNRVLEHLLDESRKKRSVVSIVGMGGLGKTTLAKRIFNEAKARFGHSVWIVVSQQYSAVGLLRDFLRQVTELGGKNIRQMTRAECEEKLYQTLEGGKYLIIMDDVWHEEVWRILSPHLPDTENGSRVLITTRSVDVGRAADPSTRPYELRFLTEESWELLSKKAFKNQEDMEAVCPEPLREVGKQIARKCGGLPLALVVLGGLLLTKGPSLQEWRRLAVTIIWENFKDGRLCLEILALSYADLPHHLKWCFLYFSSFPEDFEIEIDKLIRLWIAEGFVEHRAGETLEESAEGYLEELVRRCMMIVVQDEYDSPMLRYMPKASQRCRIHDLLHDFSIAEAKEVGFLVSRRIPDCRSASPPDSSVRRLILHGGAAEGDVSRVKSTPRVRTLLGFNFPRMPEISFPIQELKLLRVIDLDGAPLHRLPEQVGDLIHLRLLGLRRTKIGRLPSSLGNLHHLQSLDVMWTTITTMPRAVWNIEALRHVHVPDEVEPEMVEAGLRNLQVLKVVRAGSWIDSCLGTLTSLRELHLRGIEGCHHRAMLSSLPKLSLKKLVLEGASIPACLWTPSSFSSLEVLHVDGALTGERQPNSGGNQWPPNLTELILSRTSLDQYSIPALENLRELTYLCLGPRSYTGKEMIFSRGGFPQLRSLVLHSQDELERWLAEAGAMSRLRTLKIYDCRKLATLPDGLQHISALKDLTLLNMPRELCSRARRTVGQDWPKIQHIPSITISESLQNIPSRIYEQIMEIVSD